jgi:glutathione synthase/RimK-type ligase-like ATP-grasp enzyme
MQQPEDLKPVADVMPCDSTTTQKSISELLREGVFMERAGKVKEAEEAYRELLRQEPLHMLGLNQMGSLLFALGRTLEARRCFEQATAHYPRNPMSLVNMGNLLLKSREVREAHSVFEAALRADVECRPAHAGLSVTLAELGEPERAAPHQRLAFQNRCVIPTPYRGTQPPIVVLDLVATVGGNVRTSEFLTDRVFKRLLMATEFYESTMDLPPHHIVVNSIGDADIADAALVIAEEVLKRSGGPYINHPAAVRATSRCAIAEGFSDVADVVTARTVLMPREALAESAIERTMMEQRFVFPVLLRSPGFHGGDHFVKVEDASGIAAAVANLPGEQLLMMEYLDARGRDGKTRKYRVMMVDGKLYPLHAAVSSNWKIHYFSAEMADNPEHRAEDAAFLDDLPGVIGPRAMAALEKIQSVLGLDYGGIDFGLSESGEVLLFEANATMVVLIPDEGAKWDYRRPAVEAIYKAVWTMLRNRVLSGMKSASPTTHTAA